MVKRSLSVLFIVMMLLSCFSVNSFATNDTVEALNYSEASGQERATGLITNYSMDISLEGSTLNISGKTVGSAEVVKCGFKSIMVERRSSASSDWEEYAEYSDLYAESTSYTFVKQLTVSTNYQYRVTCIHYAKKHILSVEKIENTSNIVP